MKDLLIELNEGLANRLRVIASAVNIQKETDGEVHILWLNNPHLNCNFEYIFKPINNINFISETKNKYLINSEQTNILKKIIANIINSVSGYDYVLLYNPRTRKYLSDTEFLKKKIHNHKRIYLKTCYPFTQTPDYSVFHLVDTLQYIVDSFYNKYFTPQTIGIHIRRGDNKNSTVHSPIELFIDKIADILQKDSNSTFFLCSDSQDIKTLFKYHFGPCIITYNSVQSRSDSDGIKDAAIELFLLSKTSKIYGSYYSSFSEAASYINNAPLEILQII